MNIVLLSGRVARNPELRFTSSGKGVCFITLAVDGYYDRKKGEMTTDFIPVTFWGKDAEVMAKCLKGSYIELRGRAGQADYEKDGKMIYKTEIVADEFKFIAKPKQKGESA